MLPHTVRPTLANRLPNPFGSLPKRAVTGARSPHRGRRRWGLAILVALAACAEPNDEAQREVAAEIRALRLALRDLPAPQPAAPTPPPDLGAVTAALQPLREVVDQLARQQRDLATQQTALVGELQRWTVMVGPLLAAGQGQASDAARAELASMAARLQQLEQALAAQEARHREVEDLLGKTLDRTADRLEEFLQRVAPIERAAPTPTGTNPAEAKPQPAKPAPGEGVAERERIGTAPRARGWRGLPAGEIAAWLGALLTSLAIGVGFAFRLRRPAAAGTMAVGVPDRAVEDLLAVAPLLGPAAPTCPLAPPPVAAGAPEIPAPNPPPETRAEVTVEAPSPTLAVEADPGEAQPDEDLFVLDEEPAQTADAAAQPAAEPPPPPPAAAAGEPPAPAEAPDAPLVRWLLVSADPLAAAERITWFWLREAALRETRPPVLVVGPGHLQLTWLPPAGLPSGRLAGLEVALRGLARGQ